MINNETSSLANPISKALFDNFSLTSTMINSYMLTLKKLDDENLLLRIINELGEKYYNGHINKKPTVKHITGIYYKTYNYNVIPEGKCNICFNTGSIAAFSDRSGNLIKWTQGVIKEPSIVEISLICECKIGDITIDYPQKNKDLTNSIRSEYIKKFGVTYFSLNHPKLIGIAQGYANMFSCKNDISKEPQRLIKWWKDWYMMQCRKEE